MLLIATWLGAAVIGSFMGCSDNAKTDTAPPPPPPKKKSTESTQKQAPVVVEEDTTPKVIPVSDKDVANLQPGLGLRFLDSGGAMPR